MKKWLIIAAIIFAITIGFIVSLLSRAPDWLKISNDIGKALLMSSIDDTTAELILKDAAESMYANTLSEKKIEEVYRTAPFYELRYASTIEATDYYYTMYQVQDGYLFVFFQKGKSESLEKLALYYAFYGKQIFEYSDFETISVGYSSFNQVLSIDPYCNKLQTRCFFSQTAPSWDSSTVHITKTGVVVFGYKKQSNDYVVCSKENLTLEPMQNICPSDFDLLDQ